MDKNIRIFNCSIISFFYHNRFGWIRIFGYGLKFKDVSIHRFMFSERYGFKKHLRIGAWAIFILKKGKP